MTQQQSPILDYQTPMRHSRQRFSILFFIASSIILLVIHAICWFVIPKYEPIFKDFGTTLPPPTQFLLNLARIMNSPAGLGIWLLPVALGFLAPLVLPRRRFNADAEPLYRLVRILIAVMVIFLTIQAIWMITSILLYLPMNQLMESIGSSK